MSKEKVIEQPNIIVSRPDISTTELMDYTFADRLIKLPIQKYIDKLTDLAGNPIVLNQMQIAMANLLNNPDYRFITVAVARRCGKTAMANWMANLLSLEPNSNILVISPNYSLSQISMDVQLNLFKRFGIVPTKKNMKDRIIELENGSTIRMGSVPQVDSCVGRSYKLILGDEQALSDSFGNAFLLKLRPTLDTEESKFLGISSPRGDNFMKAFYERGFSEEFPQWASIWANWRINPRASEKDIAEARKSMSKAFFQQEMEASFEVLENAVYDFDKETMVIDFFETHNLVEEKFECILALDLGFRDETAFLVIAIDYDGNNVYIIDEYMAAEKTTAKHAEEINYAMNIYDVDFVYIDSAAQQTKYDLAMDYGISSINANKSVNDGLNYVASLMDNGRVFVDKNCTETIKMFINYSWDPRPGLVKPKVIHNIYSHLADCARYGIYTYGPSNLKAIGG